jgi:muramoyltetrapeptide carboxypeptidase
MQSQITIPFLKAGDNIRIIAPASVVEKDYIEKTILALQELGYKASLGEHVFSVFNQYAGTDEQRLQDFQTAIDDPDVKAVFCARGGYGSIHLIQKLNFLTFRRKPKWIAGFSDITIFHSILNNQFKLPSIHSPMPVNFSSPSFQGNLRQLNDILQGRIQDITFNRHPLNIEGLGRGVLTGGNLSILYSLQSTPYAVNTDNRILFIEDVGEQLYHLDRMMQNLSLSGKLEKLNGLIVGAFTGMKDKKRPFGKNAEEIIRDYAGEYSFPVAFGFPAGHIRNNIPFMLGRAVELEVENGKVVLRYV